MSSCAGCAAKLSQTLLAEALEKLSVGSRRYDNPDVLVGSDTFDDAGVYRLRPDLALVQTVDFFTPIVDDPYDFGQIAATNAISDVYAMGGRPLTALNLLGIPADKLGPQTIADILRGGADKAAEARCTIIGGHTIRLPEPVYGLSVTGLVHPDHILSNDRAEPGDLLVLTKPLGTGITTTGIKRGIASEECARRAIESMKMLNTPGADIAERGLARCATDVTGFGLLGHLGNILRASNVGAELIAADVPALSLEIFSLIDQKCIPGGTENNLAAADLLTDWGATNDRVRVLLADAQTSGGLLVCVPPEHLDATLDLLRLHHTLAAAVIGHITESSLPRIIVRT
jgi:selenide,water dikinase